MRTISLNCCYNLRQRRLILTSVSHQHIRDDASALVLSGLDYCNDVLNVGTPNYVVKHLQILINDAARVVFARSRFNPITGYVRVVLCRLPAVQWIESKVALLAFKALN